jgi:hypothetical protein
MRKRLLQLYTCLKFFKQDIKELIQVFQNNLQEVEIVIDGMHITDIAQIEQFGPTYQAKSLLARGYRREIVEDTKHQGERQLVELKLTPVSMVLFAQKDAGQTDPKVLTQINAILFRCRNTTQQSLIMFAFYFIFSSPIGMLHGLAQQYHLALFMQIPISVIGALLLGPTMAFFQIMIMRLLRIDRRIFLFPGTMKTTQTYGRRNGLWTITIALFLVCVFSVILTFTLG